MVAHRSKARENSLRNRPECVDYVERGAKMFLAQCNQCPCAAHERVRSAGIMYTSTEQRPLFGTCVLPQHEYLHLVAPLHEPLNQPQQTGNDALRAASIETARRENGDIHGIL